MNAAAKGKKHAMELLEGLYRELAILGVVAFVLWSINVSEYVTIEVKRRQAPTTAFDSDRVYSETLHIKDGTGMHCAAAGLGDRLDVDGALTGPSCTHGAILHSKGYPVAQWRPPNPAAFNRVSVHELPFSLLATRYAQSC